MSEETREHDKLLREIVEKHSKLLDKLSDTIWGMQFAIVVLCTTHPDRDKLNRTLQQVSEHLEETMGPEKAAPLVESLRISTGWKPSDDRNG